VQLGGGDVGHHGDDHVGHAAERRRHRGKQVTHEGLTPLAAAQATARLSLSVATMCARGLAARRAAATAPVPVHRSMACPSSGKAGTGPTGQVPALPAGDIDPGVDDDRPVAEAGVSGIQARGSPAGAGRPGLAPHAGRRRHMPAAHAPPLRRRHSRPGTAVREIVQESGGLCRQSIMAPAMGVVPGPAPSPSPSTFASSDAAAAATAAWLGRNKVGRRRSGWHRWPTRTCGRRRQPRGRPPGAERSGGRDHAPCSRWPWSPLARAASRSGAPAPRRTSSGHRAADLAHDVHRRAGLGDLGVVEAEVGRRRHGIIVNPRRSAHEQGPPGAPRSSTR